MFLRRPAAVCLSFPGLSKQREFDGHLIACEGDDGWVEQPVLDLHACLQSPPIPDASQGRDYCRHVAAVNDVTSTN